MSQDKTPTRAEALAALDRIVCAGLAEIYGGRWRSTRNDEQPKRKDEEPKR